jgi:hypothetical protein
MEDKKALAILVKMAQKYPLEPEEKEALSEAVGILSWTSLSESRIRNIKEKRKNDLDPDRP